MEATRTAQTAATARQILRGAGGTGRQAGWSHYYVRRLSAFLLLLRKHERTLYLPTLECMKTLYLPMRNALPY